MSGPAAKAKKTRLLEPNESDHSALMLKASGRVCSASDIADGSLLLRLAKENLQTFASDFPKEHLALGPVEQRKTELSLSWASCCSGSEGLHFVVEALNEAMNELGLKVHLKHKFSCESNKDKRAWIRQVLLSTAIEEQMPISGSAPLKMQPDGCIFEDITALGQGEAGCAVHDRCCPVETVDLLVLGTSCKDLSRANAGRSSQESLVLEQSTSKGGSAQTYHGFLGYVKAYENVDAIDEQLSANAQTNLDLLLATLEALDYAGQVVMTDAQEFGLPCRRKRVYVLFVNQRSPKLCMASRPVDAIFACFRRLVTSCLRSPPCVSAVLLSDEDPAVLNHLEDLEQKASMPESKKRKQGGGNWIEQHMKTAETLGIRWGGKPPRDLQSNAWFSLLTAREKDVLQLSRAAAPQAGFRNLSQSVGRSHMQTLQTNGNHIAPTMMPGQLLWTELVAPPRLVLGQEALMLQGLPISRFLEQVDDEQPPSQALMQDLAGNAMALPVVLSLLQSGLAAVWMKPAQPAASAGNISVALGAVKRLLGQQQ
ncbi:unnamed protein product [Symbiodinium sp. CCMP2592]|nr:unnamed protein product [Symbiodinium sp. CCMP2592]